MADEQAQKEAADKAAKDAADQKATADKAEADKKAAEEAGKQQTVPHQAFHEEREKRKEAEAKLATYEKEKLAKEEEEKKKKGEFENLYGETKTKAETLEKENAELKTTLKTWEDATTARIEKSITDGITKSEDAEMVRSILRGKPLAEQETLLPTLLTKFGSPDDINKGLKNGGGDNGKKEDAESKRKTAKESGNVLGVIQNAPQRAKK